MPKTIVSNDVFEIFIRDDDTMVEAHINLGRTPFAILVAKRSKTEAKHILPTRSVDKNQFSTRCDAILGSWLMRKTTKRSPNRSHPFHAPAIQIPPLTTDNSRQDWMTVKPN
jgi:hypothetical protein